MKESCYFLKERTAGQPGCAAGANFYSVGQAREVCHTCPLADLGNAPLCEKLNVYTYWERKQGNWVIRAEVECSLDERTSSDLRCAACPTSGPLVLTSAAEAAALAIVPEHFQ
jgi:hypothetical protein